MKCWNSIYTRVPLIFNLGLLVHLYIFLLVSGSNGRSVKCKSLAIRSVNRSNSPKADFWAMHQVIIVGAGPSGLLLALLLTSLSPTPQITIVEQSQTLNRSPRATHYGPVAVSVLRRAGVLDEVRRRGYMPTTLCWRALHGPRLCGFDRRLLQDDADAMTVLGVGELCAVLAEALEQKGIGIQWGQKVVALGGTEETAEVAWVEGESVATGARKKWSADVVVGCDGGNSSVRRLMFGSGNFPGFTWDQQIVATNVSSPSCLAPGED